MGIDIGQTRVLVCAQPLREHKYVFSNERMQLTKVWSDMRVNYALQTLVRRLSIHAGDSAAAGSECTVADHYAPGRCVFVATNNLYYGAQGRVLDTEGALRTGRISVELTDVPQPDLAEAQRLEAAQTTRYLTAYQAAAQTGLHHSVLSQITGTALITLGERRFPLPDNTPRVNVGLQLKFPKRGEELVGFSKRLGNSYAYTQRACELVARYAERWPQVMQAMRRRGGNGANEAQFETDVFEVGAAEGVNDVQRWLKEQAHTKAERRACGARALEEDTLREVVRAVEQMEKTTAARGKKLKLNVLPACLYLPGLLGEKSVPDAAAVYELFDRVVVVKETHSVSCGAKLSL